MSSTINNSPLVRKQWLSFSLLLLSFCLIPIAIAAQSPQAGTFLVATENLDGSSFQHTVILITHYSDRGVTGLAVNRPTNIPLNEALSDFPQFKDNKTFLFLGGPVSTNAIFVLTYTTTPGKSMHHITDNVYFTTGEHVTDQLLDDNTRIYAGYTGWGPEQLEIEIARGDWLVVKTKPDIIFEDDLSKLWHQLSKSWSGNWI